MAGQHPDVEASTTGGIAVAPSMVDALEELQLPRQAALVTPRVLGICAVAIVVGMASAFIAQALTRLIALLTNLSFHGTFSFAPASPATNELGALVVVVPVLGALVVGLMARFGSAAIRGHGIPEAMEQVLLNQSRIPARLTWLKPISAAISIGTGGPFGAEGPIIATGSALGSVVGQFMTITADERKTLLAAGAAAGMAATFGSPVSAVLLAIELLLFEYHPRSVIPVSLASVAAMAVRVGFAGTAPMFDIPPLAQPGPAALAVFVVLGAVVGVASVAITRAVYGIEDLFDRLPLHWMWWPAIGAVVVGVVGWIEPRTLGVGYDNIESILSGNIGGAALAMLAGLKLVSWSISLGSGTSGGTLAPLCTVGAGLGALLAAQLAGWFPALAIDPRVGALVGMSAMFAGASRAMLASVVFVFEITRQPMGLLPLLGGCSAAWLISCFLMRNSIMTEKIARRGARVPGGYSTDFLDQILVGQCAAREVVTIEGAATVEQVRARIASRDARLSHQGYPVLERGFLVGVVTRRDLLDPVRDGSERIRDLVSRSPCVVFEHHSLREAADLMVRENIGRLPVVRRDAPRTVIGILTRSDVLMAHRRRLHESQRAEKSRDGWRRITTSPDTGVAVA